MVSRPSHRAKRKPAAANLGCRGPIRLFNSRPSNFGSQAPLVAQLAARNNAVSSGGISPILPAPARLATLGENKMPLGETDAASCNAMDCLDHICGRHFSHDG